jgi:putative inorganic carbon (HCO3(-)) transporter
MTLLEALRRWLADYVVALVVAMVVVIPLLRFDPAVGPTVRNVALEGMAVLLWCIVLVRVDWGPGAGRRLGHFLRSGVNAPALLFLLWALISALWVAPPGIGRAFAMNDLLRLGAGVLVYLVVANHVENRRQLDTLVDALLLIVAISTIYRIFFPQTLPGAASLFGSRLMGGAFLALVLPVVAAAAAVRMDLQRQIVTRVVLVLTVVTLLVTPTRSSWMGALIGMAIFGLLAVRHLTEGVHSLWAQRRFAVYPAAALGGALVLMLLTGADTGIPRTMAARAQTAEEILQSRDESFQDRRERWQLTLGAIRRQPWLGLGLGNYVLRQQSFTHRGQTAAEVTRNGASMHEQVHNEYLHVAAELGVPGLLLYVLMLWAFFAKAVHALERLPVGTRRILLIGCVAAVAAQAVDAVSNPAWRHSVCALYFWLVLGMGTALLRTAYRATEGR